MARSIAFLYGVIAYLVFLGSLLYAVGFVTGIGVPKTIDSGQPGTIPGAMGMDLALLALFAVQHSGMARPAFKRLWTRFVPESIERSTYVLCASLILLAIFYLWRPIPTLVWQIGNPLARSALWGICALGWATLVASTFMISHAHLFGILQVWQRLRGKPLQEPEFRVSALYRVVRHPIMLGFLLAFWGTPDMSAGHLLFAAATTGYILIALRLEERDLVAYFGERYRRYREQVPMLVPQPWVRHTTARRSRNTA